MHAKKEQSSTKSFSGKGVFPARYAFTLLIPLRNLFLSPKTLIRRLHVEEDHIVLEIGPGPGYFSVPVARVVKRGRLVLLDIQQEMLDRAEKRLKKRQILNVDYLLADGIELNVVSKSMDRVFMVTVIGEIEHKKAYLKEIYRVLKDDGILSISELAGDPDKLSMEELERLVTACGFTQDECFGTQRNYTMNFVKDS